MEKEEFYRALGWRLVVARNKAGHTQRAVAQELGCAQGLVSMWEGAIRAVPAHRLAELAALYGVSVGELYGE